MADQDIEPPSDADKPASGGGERSHRLRLTPEQRRFLGPARSRHDWVGAEDKAGETEGQPPLARAVPQRTPEEEYAPPTEEHRQPSSHSVPYTGETPQTVQPATGDEISDQQQSPEHKRVRRVGRRLSLSRVFEFQNIALGLGALFVLLLAFYVGKKFEYWRYLFLSRKQAQLINVETAKFGNASAGELIERAIVEEKLGNWKEAADRFIAAKYKDVFHPGLLYRAGKIYYDHADFDSADTLFERAIAFREDVDTSNYYRGMIANGRGDYPAAERFYEAASAAAPFNADYLYSLAEALRRDHRPKEAVTRYEQAALRAGESEENICRFKMRMTMIEAGDTTEVTGDLEAKKLAGSLSVDWLMTEAALKIQAGLREDAVRAIQDARLSDRSLLHGHFAACAGDKFFSEASNKYPEIAEACRLQTPQIPNKLGR